MLTDIVPLALPLATERTPLLLIVVPDIDTPVPAEYLVSVSVNLALVGTSAFTVCPFTVDAFPPFAGSVVGMSSLVTISLSNNLPVVLVISKALLRVSSSVPLPIEKSVSTLLLLKVPKATS